MRMNHINLAVSDVAAARAFLETYFGLRPLGALGDTIALLTDENDSLIAVSNFNKSEAIAYPATFHVGFMQDSREAVDAIHARLAGDGIKVGPCKEFHGAWTFYFKAPGGFMVEVGHQHTMPGALAA